MYIDLHAEITQALLKNAALVSLLGGDHIYPMVSPDESIPSYITYQEITNFDNQFANDQALSSEIHFQFDIWTPYNTGPIAKEVDRTMEELNFVRTSSVDGYDNDSTPKRFRKILRYKSIKYGG